MSVCSTLERQRSPGIPSKAKRLAQADRLYTLARKMPPKYSSPEIERRWLVREECLPETGTARRRHIEDKYIDGGRLRLGHRTSTPHTNGCTEPLGWAIRLPLSSLLATAATPNMALQLPGAGLRSLCNGRPRRHVVAVS